MQRTPPAMLDADELMIAVGAALARPLALDEREFLAREFPRGYSSAHVVEVIDAYFTPRSHVLAAQALVNLLRRRLTPQEFERLKAWFPNGVPPWVLESVAQKLRRPQPLLRLVVGGKS